MTQVSVHLPRWTTASIFKYFEDQLNAYATVRRYTGQENVPTNLSEFFDVRYDGPFLSEMSKNYWRVYVEVNILASKVLVTSQAYALDVLVGYLVNAFTAGPIHIYKLGSGPDDDGSFIGCLELLQGGREKLEVNRLGTIHQDKGLQQTMVEGHYEGEFSLP